MASGQAVAEGLTVARRQNLMDGFVTARAYLLRVCSRGSKAIPRAAAKDKAACDERLQALINDSPDFIFVFDDDGQITYVSPAAERFSGGIRARSLDQLLELVDPAVRPVIVESMANPAAAPANLSMRVNMPTGDIRVVDFTIRDGRDNPSINGIVVTGRDITERARLEEQLVRQANEDELTGLANRRALNKHLDAALDRAARSGRSVAVVLLDLDGFKAVNDTMGHPVGDLLLTELGVRLRSRARVGELVARIGGDEFAVVLEGLKTNDEARAFAAAERFSMALVEPFVLDGRVITLTASAGVALSHANGDLSSDLMRRSDIALYDAKRRGRNRATVFHDDMQVSIFSNVLVGSELLAAICNREFSLAYQPLVDAALLEVVGFEAVIRFGSRTLAEVTPAAVMTAAERSGVVNELGRWALTSACERLAELNGVRSDDPLLMWIGVSPHQLRDDNFAGDLARILDTTGVERRFVTLQVAETAIAEDDAELIEGLHRVRSIGVRVALDGFGVGSSSMARLCDLPIDSVKIDA